MSDKTSIDISGLENFSQDVAQQVEDVVCRVIDSAFLPDVLISIAFIHDDEMQKLNKQYRGKNKPTDVLSFSAQEGEMLEGMEHILGDIIISIDTAQAQAQELEHTLLEEIAVLLAHGIMHLLGLDHERSEEEAMKQAEGEMAVLDHAGFSPRLALASRFM